MRREFLINFLKFPDQESNVAMRIQWQGSTGPAGPSIFLYHAASDRIYHSLPLYTHGDDIFLNRN